MEHIQTCLYFFIRDCISIFSWCLQSLPRNTAGHRGLGVATTWVASNHSRVYIPTALAGRKALRCILREVGVKHCQLSWYSEGQLKLIHGTSILHILRTCFCKWVVPGERGTVKNIKLRQVIITKMTRSLDVDLHVSRFWKWAHRSSPGSYDAPRYGIAERNGSSDRMA